MAWDPFESGTATETPHFDPFESGAAEETAPPPKPEAPKALDPAKLFGGVDNWKDTLDPATMSQIDSSLYGEPDKKLGRMRAANVAYVAKQTGKPLAEIAPAWDQWRDQYAKDVLKAPAPLDDAGFYGAVSSSLDRQAKENALVHGMVAPLFDSLRKGGSFNATYSAQLEAARGQPGFDPARQDIYRQVAKQTWDKFTADETRLSGPIELATKYFAIAKNGFPGEEAQGAALHDQLMTQLQALAPDDATMVMDFAAGASTQKPKGAVEKAGFGEKAGFAFESGVGDLAGNAIGAGEDLIERAFDTPQEATDSRRRRQLERAITQRLTGEVAPVSADGYIGKQILNVSEAAPKLLAFMSTPGIVMSIAAAKEEQRAKFEDQGMSDNQSEALSTVTAAIDVPLNFLEAKFVVGLVPGVNRLANAATNAAAGRLVKVGVGQGLARFGANVAKNAAVETAGLAAVTAFQQIASPAVVTLARNLDSSIPGKDFLSEMSSIAHSAPETLANLVPFILIGTGSGHFRDRAEAMEKLKNQDHLEAIGTQAATIAKIQAAETPEDIGAILERTWSERQKGAAQQAALERVNLTALQVREQLGEVIGPNARALFEKYPAEFNSLSTGAIPAEIRKADGTTEPVTMSGYTDQTDPDNPGKTRLGPLLGRFTEMGWSHGRKLEAGETLSPVPTPERWLAGDREAVPVKAPEAASVSPEALLEQLAEKPPETPAAEVPPLGEEHIEGENPEPTAPPPLEQPPEHIPAEETVGAKTLRQWRRISGAVNQIDRTLRGTSPSNTRGRDALLLKRLEIQADAGIPGANEALTRYHEQVRRQVEEPDRNAAVRDFVEKNPLIEPSARGEGVVKMNGELRAMRENLSAKERKKAFSKTGRTDLGTYAENLADHLMGAGFIPEGDLAKATHEIVGGEANLADFISDAYANKKEKIPVPRLDRDVPGLRLNELPPEPPLERLNVARNASGEYTITGPKGELIGTAGSPEGAAAVVSDHHEATLGKANEGPTNIPAPPDEEAKPPAPAAPPERLIAVPRALLDLEESVNAKLEALRQEGRLGANPFADPEILKLSIQKTALILARGAIEGAKFAEEMVRAFGESVRPHLAMLRERGQAYLDAHIALAEVDHAIGKTEPEDVTDTAERTVTSRVGAGEGVAKDWSQEARDSVVGAEYNIRHMDRVRGEASAEIAKSPEAALARFLDPRSDIANDVRTSMGIQLAKHFYAAGDHAAWRDTVMALAEYGTSQGQGVNMFKDLGQFFTTPEQAQILLAQEVNNAKKKIRKRDKTDETAEEVKNVVEDEQGDAKLIADLKKRMEGLVKLTNEGTLNEISDKLGPKPGAKKESQEVQDLRTMIAGAEKHLKGELKTRLQQLNLRPLLAKIDEQAELMKNGTPEEIRKYFEKPAKIEVNEDVKALRDIVTQANKDLRDKLNEATDTPENLTKLRETLERLTKLTNEGSVQSIADELIKPSGPKPSTDKQFLLDSIAGAREGLRTELKTNLDPDSVRARDLRQEIDRLTQMHNRGDVSEMAKEIHGEPAGKRQEPPLLEDLRTMLAEVKKAMKGDLKTGLDVHAVKLRDLSVRLEENVRLLNEGTEAEIRKHLEANPKKFEPADVAELKKLVNQSKAALEKWIKPSTDFEKKITDRLKAKNISTPKNVRDLYKKALDLHAEGKLSTRSVEDVLISKHNLPDLGEHAAALADHAARIASTPEASATRRDATIALFDYVDRTLAPLGILDKGFALFYAHILSGYSTSVRNSLSNLGSLTDLGLDLFLSNPSAWMAKYDGIVNGGRAGAAAGLAEALHVFRTGKESSLANVDPKFGASGVLEQTNFTGIARPYNLSKYVGRALRAQDVFFATTVYEAKSRQIAWEMAERELGAGTDPQRIVERVDQILNQSPQQISDFTAQAVQEQALLHPELAREVGAKQWIENRVRELTMLNRDGQLVERASDLAQRLTFNYKPEGLTGYLASLAVEGFAGVRKAGQESGNPLLHLVSILPRIELPFIRVPANLLGRAIEYGAGPITLVKAAIGRELVYKGGARASWDVMSNDVRSMMIKRGLAGMVGLATLAALGYPSDKPGEEDKKTWRIHGAGTGKAEKDRALWGPKFRPYSIQLNVGKSTYFVPYQFLSTGPALAMVGTYHDGIRYKKWNDKDGSMRLASAMSAIPVAMLQRSFFQAAADAADAIVGKSHTSEESLRRALARATAGTAASVAIPLAGFWNSLDRDMDPNARDIGSVKASLMSQVPIARHLLNAKLDALGDPMTNRPADWFYTQAAANTPEAAIYRVLAHHNLDPGDGSEYRQELGEKYYDFYRARQQIIKGRLLDPEFLARLDREDDHTAQSILSSVGDSATARALRVVDYRRPRPQHAQP